MALYWRRGATFSSSIISPMSSLHSAYSLCFVNYHGRSLEDLHDIGITNIVISCLALLHVHNPQHIQARAPYDRLYLLHPLMVVVCDPRS